MTVQNEGNHFSQRLDDLDPPFDSNTVYSSHNYVEPMDGVYPGLVNGVPFDSMMQSFAFKNCRPRQDLIELLKRKLYTSVKGEVNF